ncbi:hypothetical protein OIO90_002966 [Microbotryomycetes sp. JL221]|nr:hypothetical protein OIO90_002966 [Microbotryomycetes sp. JL221]
MSANNIPPPPPGFPGHNSANTPVQAAAGPAATAIPLPPPGGPPTQMSFLPPVPPPWTEHRGLFGFSRRSPGGQPYWFNPQTNVSTYARPGPPVPPPGFYPGAPPLQQPMLHQPLPQQQQQQQQAASPTKKEKKEKPKEKKPIHGTNWLKVTTNKGNVFWTNSETKESVWTVPDDIKDIVEQIDKQEREAREQVATNGKKRKADDVAAAADQQEGNKTDQADTEPTSKLDVEVEAANGQSKSLDATEANDNANGSDQPDEVVVEPKKKKQKKKVVREIEELEQDEEWQKQVAEEMAKEVEEAEERAQQEKEDQKKQAEAQQEPSKASAAADLDVSQEEAAAFFKVMLSEKDIDPMAPWDMELPKFINDPRYLAVKQLKIRRDLFDEFCKDKIRERRAAKKKATESGAVQTVDPTTAYRDLLKQHVTSTRTHFSDFKKAHQKDPRFKNFGKTEGDKEKVFRQWLRELGEHKRAQAILAEEKFVDMLKEDNGIRRGDKWSDVKVRHSSDKRYQAVTSSSLRESLFNKYAATLGDDATQASSAAASSSKGITKEERAARAQASLREREAQVRAEKERAAKSAGVARHILGREEGEREFGTLLVDTVRDHEARWEDVVKVLSRDSRFADSPLSTNDKRRLFDQHTRSLYDKRLKLVHELFSTHAPSLVTPFHDVLPNVRDSPHVKALVRDDYDALESMYDKWSRIRMSEARTEFDMLLKESPIIEHWGRLQKKKIGDDEDDGKVGMQHEGDEDEDDDDEMPSLTEMARQIDLPAIHKTLKHDKRYTQFDFDPDAREQWVKDYLEELKAPKQTVHQR